jgi:hypothetical protein
MADTPSFLLQMMELLVARFRNATNIESGAADWVLFLPDSAIMFEWKHNTTRFIVASGADWRVAVDFFLQNPHWVRVCVEAGDDDGPPLASFEHVYTFRCPLRFEAFVNGELASLVEAQHAVAA